VEASLQEFIYFAQFPKYVYPQEIQEPMHLLTMSGEDPHPIID